MLRVSWTIILFFGPRSPRTRYPQKPQILRTEETTIKNIRYLQKSEKFGGPQKSESITGPQKSENIGHSLKSENPRTLRAENHLGLAEASEDASSLANPCSGNVAPKTSENLGPARTHPSENMELARGHPGESLSRTLSRGGLPSDNLSRGGLLSDNLSRGPGYFSDTLSRGSGQFSESRTLQFGPRQRLIIGADAIVREREVRKKSQKLLKIPFFIVILLIYHLFLLGGHNCQASLWPHHDEHFWRSRRQVSHHHIFIKSDKRHAIFERSWSH